MLLNFYARPPQATLARDVGRSAVTLPFDRSASTTAIDLLAVTLALERVRKRRIQGLHLHATKKCIPVNNFFAVEVVHFAVRCSAYLFFGAFHMKSILRLVSFAVLLAVPLLLPATQAPPAKRPITIADFFRIQQVHDPQIDTAGHWVAYTVTSTNLTKDKSESRIWMVPASGGEAIPLTAEDASSTHPRWSPDGKWLAFLSARDQGKTQVWLLNRLGGEAQKLTNTPQDVKDFVWSPDSTRLVLILKDASPEELAAASEKAKGEATKEKEPKTPKPWVIDRLQFKEDTIGYLDHRRTHLYIFDLASKSLTQVTSGDFDDSEPAWSPDGKLLAFVSNRSLPDPDRTYDTNVWIVAADNTDKGAHLTQVTTNPGADFSPAWSPDGKWIACVTQLDPKLFQYATQHIAVMQVPALGEKPGVAKVLTLALDRNSTEPHFATDGKSVYFIADDDGTQNLLQVNMADEKITRPIGGRLMLYSYSLSKSGEIAANITTLDRPSEIFTLIGGKLERVTHTSDALMSQLKLSQGEYVSFKSKDGTIVHGYLYKPLDYVPGKKYPTLLRPHGGPVWAYYAEFSHLAQLFAANGYAVFLPNPRGSSGYGEPYCKAIWADWGGKDFEDDMAMVDYAIAQGIADPDKLGVGGWSYGGISTDFIIGQTNRFKAAISGAGASEFISLYGHDEYQRDYYTELGYPWEHRATWDKLAYFYKVENIKTPALFMGGNLDANVPVLGGEQMYQALRALGRQTELVVYPNEYHEFTIPSHIEDRLKRYLAWYNHYVKGDAAPASLPPDTSKLDPEQTK
jgi:dipeptidyl aminopeptidase/acylaminoacyl peptidase